MPVIAASGSLFFKLSLFFELSFFQEIGSTLRPLVDIPNVSGNYAILGKPHNISVKSCRWKETTFTGMVTTADSNMIEVGC